MSSAPEAAGLCLLMQRMPALTNDHFSLAFGRCCSHPGAARSRSNGNPPPPGQTGRQRSDQSPEPWHLRNRFARCGCCPSCRHSPPPPALRGQERPLRLRP
ncbi:hypothetical protein CCHR01_09414 [Colletotrichum chrysophilum]|uniref:Uncharacterized protein n=1 Tax=Colletotrichum chrysophilum TaxID=1836956 RepID=A0AAD9EGT0_9PEZI|nr:hypothetical protein CCHR01_09414 [Colletotrichum chrysophilum]